LAILVEEMAAPKPDLDWEAIEREYRAGQLSVTQIGRLNGCSHTAVLKRAKKYGWTRNLAERVREEVSARLVSDELSAETTRETIEAAAERVVQLVREHRRDIREGRDAVNALVTELRETTRGRNDIEEAIHEETAGDPNTKRRGTMLRAVSLSARSGVAASLAIALKNLIYCERNAFGLSTREQDGGSEEGSAGLAERLDAAFKRIEG
jgi:hypothetical protein